eukprot:COSAG01_NODE_2316_length_7924_cov_6.999361_4_plen_74_part_00
MAFDIGAVTGPTDFALRDALASLNMNDRDSGRWETLPFAFAATLGTQLWVQAKYMARLGGAVPLSSMRQSVSG